MAQVTTCSPGLNLPQSGRDSWNQSDGFTTYEYTRTYVVTTDTAVTNQDIILKSSRVPQMFEADSFNRNARVSSREATRTENALTWNLSVTYSTNAPTAQQGDTNGTPLGAKVRWTTSTEPIQLPMSKDVKGKPVLLSNGLPPNPPLMVTRMMVVFRAERNEAVYPIYAMKNIAGRVNSATFLGISAGYLMCRIPSVSQDNSNGVEFFKTFYEFVYHPLGWQPKLLNAAYMAWNSSKGMIAPILDDNGEEVTQPWPLDDNGNPLSSASIIAGTVTFKNYDAYETTDFNYLGLVLP